MRLLVIAIIIGVILALGYALHVAELATQLG